MTINNHLVFQDNGSPYSKKFDDIYFDCNTGITQSKHIFIDGNNIVQRLRQAKANFIIAETGFGTGLNFLLTLQAYQQAQIAIQKIPDSPEMKKLTFISIEKYPLTRSQLKHALQSLPELTKESASLIAQYPEKPQGECKLFFLSDKITLHLIFTDVSQALTQLANNKKTKIDAWYLDGFSPRKNPDMWSQNLFEIIARLSKDQATLSTFTIAGIIRRRLQNVGFRYQKKSTSGHKKQILIAKYQQNKLIGKGYQLRPIITKPQHVTIIGGGIASACLAYALTKQGVKVTLYCQDKKVAQGASSNAIGALYPLLHQQQDAISLFYQQAFWHAKKLYQNLLEQGFHFSHQWCGLLDLSYKNALQQRQTIFEKNNAWPKELIYGVDAQQASKIANIALPFGGLFMPNAGWIAPAELVEQLFNAAQQTNRLKVITNIKIRSLEKLPNGDWKMHSVQQHFIDKVVIVCGGAESINLNIINQLPLTSVRGQVSNMRSNQAIAPLNTVLCHKGYLTPVHNNIHCIGATFDKNDLTTDIRTKDDEYNLTMLNNCLPGLTSWTTADIAQSKARSRCMTPDHLPIVGAVPDITGHQLAYAHLAKDKNWRYHQPAPVIDNLYIMAGLGARGLCSAPLIADILAADICASPYPVDSNTLFNLSANRFTIRDIIKGKI